jgi:molybdate transport system substrate-binding protein
VRPRVRPALLLVLAGTIGLACGAGAPDAGGTITVFAAASLTEAFTDIGAAFEAAKPGTDVRFAFAASSDLARQLL